MEIVGGILYSSNWSRVFAKPQSIADDKLVATTDKSFVL